MLEEKIDEKTPLKGKKSLKKYMNEGKMKRVVRDNSDILDMTEEARVELGDWREVCDLYFENPELDISTISIDEVRIERLRAAFGRNATNRTGTSSWMSIALKILFIPIAAVPFSKILTVGTDGGTTYNISSSTFINGTFANSTFVNSTMSGGGDYNYGNGLGIWNNVIFTVTTYLSHWMYAYSEQIHLNCQRNEKLFSDAEHSARLLWEYAQDKKYDVKDTKKQCLFISGIIAKSFDNALRLRGIASLENLNNFRVSEYALNMFLALNSFLISELRHSKLDNEYHTMGYTPELSEKLSKEFGNIIASTLHKRCCFSNLIRGQWPNHAQMGLTPTIDNYLEIIKKVMVKTHGKTSVPQVISLISEERNGKKEKIVNRTSLVIDRSRSESDDDEKEVGTISVNKAKVEDIEFLPTKIKKVSEKHKVYYQVYKDFLEENRNKGILQGLSGGIEKLSDKKEEGNIAARIYKFFSASFAGIVFLNPFSDNSQAPWYFKYLVACGSGLISFGCYLIYNNIQETRCRYCATYDRLQEVVKSLYAKKLITKDEGSYTVSDQVEQIHQIIRKSFDLIVHDKGIALTDLKDAAEGEIFAKMYSALGEVWLEMYDKEKKFFLSKRDEDNIARAFAEEIKPKINREVISSISTVNNPSKYVVNKPIFEEILIDSVRANIGIIMGPASRSVVENAVAKWVGFVEKRKSLLEHSI